MRISIRKDDPGYKENANKYRITFNGQERTDVFTADEEKGLIHCYDEKVKNGKKLRMVDPKTHQPKERIFNGKVVIIPPGASHPVLN